MSLMPLSHAFLFALGTLEAAWDVPEAERLGSSGGEEELYSWYAFGCEPTGAALKEALEHLGWRKWLPNIDKSADADELALYHLYREWPEGLYQSGRLRKKNAKEPIFIVPRVPSASERSALMKDAEDPDTIGSDHERRLVEVIRFFNSIILLGKLTLVGDSVAGHLDRATPSRSEAEEYAPAYNGNTLEEVFINFQNNTIRFRNDRDSPITPEDEEFESSLSTKFLVHRRNLNNLIHDWLDETPEHDDIHDLSFEVKFFGRYTQFAGDEHLEPDVYGIYLAGSNSPLSFDLTGKPRIEEGFMAIDFLNRNKGVKISHQLLSRLTWRLENQKVPVQDNGEDANKVSQELKEIGFKMYLGEIDIPEAHIRCAELLSKYEDQRVPRAIPHTPEFGKGLFSQYDEFEYRKSELIKKIKRACVEIGKSDARGKKISEYIELNLQKELYYLLFRI